MGRGGAGNACARSKVGGALPRRLPFKRLNRAPRRHEPGRQSVALIREAAKITCAPHPSYP